MHIKARSETQNKIETIIIDRIESYMSFNDLTEEGFNSRPSRDVCSVKKTTITVMVMVMVMVTKSDAIKQREIDSIGPLYMSLPMDKITSIRNTFYSSTCRQERLEFITMQNRSQSTSRTSRKNSLSFTSPNRLKD